MKQRKCAGGYPDQSFPWQMQGLSWGHPLKSARLCLEKYGDFIFGYCSRAKNRTSGDRVSFQATVPLWWYMHIPPASDAVDAIDTSTG